MGKGPGLFSDIGKKAKDLLTRDYLQDQKISISTQTESGLSFTSSSSKKGGLVVGDIATQYRNKNVTTDVKLDTDSNIHTTVTVDDLGPGVKSILSFKYPDYTSGKLEVQYRHEHVGVGSAIGLTSAPVVDFNAVFGSEDLAIGGEVGFDSASGVFTKYNVGVGITKPDFSAAALVTDKGETIKVSYLHNVNPATKLSVAAEVLHKLSTKETTFTVGSTYALDRLTTVKTRLNNHGKLGALVQHELWPKSIVTLSSEVDTKALDRHPKVGLALALRS